MKFLLKNKTRILIFLFVIPLLFSLCVQYEENVKKYDYWNYQVLKKFSIDGRNIATEEEINNLKNKYDVIKFKEEKKEIIRKFLPTSEQYRDFSCYKKFNTNSDETMDIIINSLGVLQANKINDECFSDESKKILFVSYIFIYIAIFFTIIALFTDKIRRLIPYKNHIAIIGLNKYSREIIKQISDEDNIKIYDNNSSNKYINELEDTGEMIIYGKLEYTIESNNCDIINAKEIYIINENDSESINNLALILNKFKKHKNRKIKDKTKIYIEIKNRENKSFFDKKGIYDELITDNYEIYPFSINEIIVQKMFKNKPLVSNIKNINGKYEENLKILIVGFNDLSEEILYNILKLGHFDLKRIVEVTVIDDKYELLNCKYNRIIERGKKPYENSDETLWNLEFLPYKSLYENRVFNRIILCDKEQDNGIDILSYLSNNHHIEINRNNTIIQVFNEHKNINSDISKDQYNFKNFFTFGDIEATVKLDNIKNNKLYKVAEYTNDFKEKLEFKKWKNIDNFTRESNITDKLHMETKLHAFGLKIKEADENLEKKYTLQEYLKLHKNFFENKKDSLYEALELLPNALEILKEFKKDYENSKDGNEFYEKIKDKLKYKKSVLEDEIEKLKTTINKFKISEEKEKIEHFKEDFDDVVKYRELSNEVSSFKFSNKADDNWSELEDILKEIEKMREEEYVIYLNKNKENMKILFNSIVDEIKKSSDLLEIINIKGKRGKKVERNLNKYKIMEEKEKIEHFKEDYYRIKNYKELSKKVSSFKFSDTADDNWSELEDILKKIESMTEEEYVDYLNKNKENMKTLFNSIVDEIKKSSKLIGIICSEKEQLKVNEHNVKIAFIYSLVNFYKKIKDNPNNGEIIHQLAQIEHTRWNAYHILNGWTRRKGAGKDMLKKEHFDLCDWKTLEEDDPDNVKYDYKNIYQIPFVAYCLGFEIEEI